MATYPTIANVLEQSAKRYPEKDALIYPRRDQTWTYAEFDEKANRLANSLSDLGVEKGDRVATDLFNGSEILLTCFACAKIGAVFTPLNYRLKAGEVEFILNDAEATALVFEEETRVPVEGARDSLETVGEYLFIDDDVPEYANDFYDLVAEGSPERPDTVVEEDDVYAFIYTSGTTGRPKGVVHEHRDMVEHNLLCIGASSLTKNDTGLSALPLYHCAELHAAVFPRIHVGATSIVHHDVDPAAILRDVEEYGVTIMFAAPTVWNMLAQAAEGAEFDTSSLRLGMYGASPMPSKVLERCMEQFTDDYLQAYGMTEIGPCGTFQYPDEQVPKLGSAGKAALNHDLRVVEPDADPDETVEQGEIGEVLLTGPCTMREYWNRPEATAESLREDSYGTTWYYSGDLGYLDEDGFLWVVDRKDDMIISGGENIYPTEVEDVLFAHDDVIEAAVLGEPHEEWGEVVVAYIVGDTDGDTLDTYLRESDDLADFKRPREYYFVDELPKNPSGKVQKFKLRDEE